MVSVMFRECIQKYLDARASSDDVFAGKLAEKAKRLKSIGTDVYTMACNFIIGEVRKANREGFADEEVFGWAVHYIDEAELLKIEEENARVVVNHHVEAETPKVTQKCAEKPENQQKRACKSNKLAKRGDVSREEGPKLVQLELF